MEPERLPHPPLDPVTVHGLSDSLGDGKTQARGLRSTGFSRPSQAEGREQRAGDAEALVINRSEIGGAKNPGRPGKGART
jgi:hypothetical protein